MQLDKNGYTALLWEAAANNNVYDTRKSIASKIDVNTRDKFGMTALHRAVVTSSYDVIKILLCVPEIDISKIDNGGETPMDIAQRFGNTKIIVLLEEAIGKRSMLKSASNKISDYSL